MEAEMMRNEDRTLDLLFTYLDAHKAFVNDSHPDFRNSMYQLFLPYLFKNYLTNSWPYSTYL
jgi:hypothetical protein